ncbi:MAG TPA: SMP-30/gluconolactonase/LRE family protein [Puia sp.]
MKVSPNIICIASVVFFSLARSGYGQKTHSGEKQEGAIIAAGIKPVLIDSRFSFTEGPAVDKQGNVFFTDQPNNRIWEYDINGKLKLFLDSAGRSNGMYFDSKGNLITCADEKDQLWSIDKNKKIRILLKDYRGHRLNGPNDLWISPSGDIYLTDPYFQRDYWTRKMADPALGGEKLYCLRHNQKELILVESETVKPNGLVGAPDGKWLYVADMGLGKTFRYGINPDGTLKNKQLFVNQASDGMTIDNRGNIYLTGDGVSVYNPAGKKIAQIDIPEKWTANICFYGKEKNILFITASKSIYLLPTRVKGVE